MLNNQMALGRTFPFDEYFSEGWLNHQPVLQVESPIFCCLNHLIAGELTYSFCCF